MLRALIAAAVVTVVTSSAAAERAAPATCRPAARAVRVQLAATTSLRDLATWVSAVTCKNVVFGADAEKHAPSVTVIAPNAVTSAQAAQLFLDAARAVGLTAVQTRDTIIVHVAPPACGPATATTPVRGPDVEHDPTPGIRVTGDLRREIEQTFVDEIIANPTAFARGARMVPSIKDGTMNGFKLYAIRPSSMFARLGFTNGDTVMEVNGHALTSVDATLEAYTKLRGHKKFTFQLLRRGKPATLVITVK